MTETKQFMYTLTVSGKPPRKRNAREYCVMVKYYNLDAVQFVYDVAVAYDTATLVREHKLRNATFRLSRTVVTRCVYDDGTTCTWGDVFDVNYTVLASGPVGVES